MSKDLTKERDSKCIPIATKILDMINSYDKMIGDIKEDETIKHYKDLEVKIIKCYLDNKLTSGEIIYVQQLLLQAVDLPLNFVKQSVIDSYERATEKLFGKPERDISLSDVDKILS